LNVTVRNYLKKDASSYVEDIKVGAFDYINLPWRPFPGCFGASLVRPGASKSGDSAGDTLLFAAMVFILVMGPVVTKGVQLVRVQFRQVMAAALFVLLLGGVALPARAFFPLGGYGVLDLKLKYVRWPLNYMDTNLDGDVSGPDEGVEITIESGENGFSSDEIETVKEAFKVWQDVPTAYVGFRYTNTVSDPFDFDTSAGESLLNFVAMETPDDVYRVGVGGLVLGLTLLTAVIDEVYAGDMGFPISGGQIIKADIIIDSEAHRPTEAGTAALADLRSTLVHEVGHLIGLGHTPLNNLELVEDERDYPLLVESPVFAQRDVAGRLAPVGATPTMFPIYFFVDDGMGNLVGGQQDLAPDDIAGVSFLYPRGSQDNFFTITHWARTQTRTDFPSMSIGGGHVVAWVDADNDSTTARVPLISTMTGLYEPDGQVHYSGRFHLRGLLKEIETLGGVPPFLANYVLTLSPINELDITRMAPEGYTPEDFNSIEGSNSEYNTAFISEVFHEAGNLLDMDNRDVGTPLAFDRERNTVVSVDTDKTLPTMLPGQVPMFGDRVEMCPLNVATEGLETSNVAQGLRRVRDDMLLHTAAGAALVDAYYTVAPTTAAFLVRHTRVLAVVRACAARIEWAYTCCQGGWLGLLLVMTAGVAAVFAAYKGRKRARALTALFLVLVGLCAFAAPANASIVYVTTPQLVEISEYIVIGGGKRIVTDVTIEVYDCIKGQMNTGQIIHIQLPGGRVGSVVTKAIGMPIFREGEEVLFYLTFDAELGYLVVGGCRGKFEVWTNPETGEKYVLAASPEAKTALRRDAATVKTDSKDSEGGAAVTNDNRIPLNDYRRYLRKLVKGRQKR